MLGAGCGKAVENDKLSPPNTCAKGQTLFAYEWPPSPFAVAVSEFAVKEPVIYFTDMGSGRILSISVLGGLLFTQATGEASPLHITVDETNLYWTTESEIRKMPLAGGPPVTLATSTGTPQSIAIDAQYVYWTTGLARLMRAAIDGSETTELVDASATAFAFAGMALDDAYLYWASHGSGGTNSDSIMKMPKEGGPVTTLATGQSFPWRIAVDRSHVYWTNAGDFNTNVGLMKLALDGGDPLPLLSTQSPAYAQYASLAGVFVNAKGVYVASTGTQEYDHYNGAVIKLPLEGGDSTTLTSEVRKAQDAMVVRDCSVFYAADGKLFRIDGDI